MNAEARSIAMTTKPGAIRVGIGGWTFEPWRGVFFPPGMAHAKELAHAAGKLTAIEVNGTYYSSQSPATFAKWAKETPDGFVFALKASRFCTNRKVLAEARASVEKFLTSGIVELGDKLGPILWQFMPTKKFDADDFGAFLKLLPERQEGLRLRHAVEVRHESFLTSAFVELARDAGVAIVFADTPKYPAIADLTADFVYARLQDAQEEVETGYDAEALDRWADTARAWAKGAAPQGLGYIDAAQTQVDRGGEPKDVFVFMINGAKVRAPAAAMGLIDRLRSPAA
jgi:uncharacterized protein YecE (DUF72 family)